MLPTACLFRLHFFLAFKNDLCTVVKAELDILVIENVLQG
jgi:hypothetical protein